MSAPKILVADDSPLVLRMIEKMLQGAGFGVVTAKDGLEAIERAFVEDVSLVILDVMMPRMNGYQACRLLKTEPATKQLPVVILTSKDQAGDRFWGLETGADHYVTKDADPQGILDLVRKIVAAAPATPRGPARRDSVDILSRVNELLDRKLFEATLLSELGRVARSLVNFDETFASVMRVLTRVVDFSVGGMAFVDEDELDVYLMVHRPASPAVIEETKARLLEAVARERGSEPFAKVQARLFTEPASAGMPEEVAIGGFVAYPIRTNDALTGILGLAGKAAARVAGESEAFLQTAAQQAKIVMENSRLFDKVKALSIRDSLTGLYNHRHTMEQVANEFGRVGRYEGGVSLLMIDIDHFKQVNDQQGHQAGDVILRDVARILKDTLRVVDSVGRYGGEEFVCILPHTSQEEALQTAERIRVSIADHVFRVGNQQSRVTVSIGVATYPSQRVDSPGGLLREADKALYRAKEAGRNRIA